MHTPSLARPSVLTQKHVWLFDLYLCSSSRTYHCLFDDWYACSCLDRISFVCLSDLQPHSSDMFMSPFVPFQSSIVNRLLRVRPSQKLVYENLLVQTKIINGRSRMKFYLKHHWDGGKASVGFDLDLIRTLVSMATVRVTVGKTASSNSRMFLIRTFLILAGNDDMHEILDEFEIWPDRSWTTELAALQHMKKILIGKTMSSHFLQYF